MKATTEQRSIDELQADELRFRALSTGLPHLVFGCRSTGERTWPSPQWVIYTGCSETDSVHFGWVDAVHPDDRHRTLAAWQSAPERGIYLVEHRIWCTIGQVYRWHQTRAAPLPEPLSDGTTWVGSSDDTDDMRRLQTRLSDAERQLRVLVEGVPQLLWRSCDQGNWTWASPQWLAFTGQTQEETHGRGWLNAVMPEDRAALLCAWTEAQPSGLLDIEFRVYHASADIYVWHRTCSSPVYDDTGKIIEWLGTTSNIQSLKDYARDLESEIQERKRIESRLSYIAFHDDLTRLRSRQYLMDKLASALSLTAREGRPRCAMLFLDLDRFKLVNDSLGHQAGDQVLIEVAHRLSTCIRPEHTLARLSGDEFAILLEVPEPAEPVTIAQAVIAAMRPAVKLGEQEVFTSCSIGVIEASDRHKRPEDLLRDADTAMYHAKRHDVSHFAVFTETMRDQAIEALRLRTDLHHALGRNELFLHYQPICRAIDGQIIGAEALVRWQHPSRGVVPPTAFIGAAEDVGLIRELGQWVLRTACLELRSWQKLNLNKVLRLSVNVSAKEFENKDYARQLGATIEEAGIDPSQVQLEVTETIFLHSPDLVRTMLKSIREQGVRIALDDFGTGYSSLSYLGRYDVDTLKIDQSFVTQMVEDERSKAIVKAIAQMGHIMKLDIVAEGVETRAQLEALTEAGCHHVQGYFLGRPMSGNDFGALLASKSIPMP